MSSTASLLPKTSATNPERLLPHLRKAHSAPPLPRRLGHGWGHRFPAALVASLFSQEPQHMLLRAATYLLLYLLAGIALYVYLSQALRGLSSGHPLVDAIYFSVVTMTTVGYGDLAPNTASGKLLTCAFVFLGLCLVNLLLTSAASYLIGKQERLLETALSKVSANKGKARKNSDFLGLEKYAPPSFLDSKDAEWRSSMKPWVKIITSSALVLFCFTVGVWVLTKVEQMSLVDALYCACVTMSTVGYGDRSFQSLHGRIFASIWILFSTLSVAHLFLCITEIRVLGRQNALSEWVLNRKLTSEDLREADMDDDGKVSLAEFILFKLKELGKVEEVDIAAITKEFELLDVNGDYQLDEQDVEIAQDCSGSGTSSSNPLKRAIL